MKTFITEHKIPKNKIGTVILLLQFVLIVLLLVGMKVFLKDSLRAFVESIKQNNLKTNLIYLAVFTLIYIAAIVVHELIHGFFFARYNISGWKGVKFGIIPKMMAAYATTQEPLEVRQFRIVILMPTLLLGIIPLIIAFITGNFYIFMFAFFMILGGTGDFAVLWFIRKLNSRQLIIDHPKTLGYFSVENFHPDELIEIQQKIKELTEDEKPKKMSKKDYLIIIGSFLIGIIFALIFKQFLK